MLDRCLVKLRYPNKYYAMVSSLCGAAYRYGPLPLLPFRPRRHALRNGQTRTQYQRALGQQGRLGGTINLSGKYYSGKQFIITNYKSLRKMPKDEEIYVQEYSLNGKKLTDPHIPFADVIEGGKLKIKMGREPVDKY